MREDGCCTPGLMPNAGVLRPEEAGAHRGDVSHVGSFPCRAQDDVGGGDAEYPRVNIEPCACPGFSARFWALARAQVLPNFHRIALSNEVSPRMFHMEHWCISAPGSTVRTLVITPSLPRKLVRHYAVQLNEARIPKVAFPLISS